MPSQTFPASPSVASSKPLPAAAYFSGWVANDAATVSFANRDLRLIPEHWLRYNGRRSVIGSGNTNRRADRPLNALLNYAFALAKAEAALAATIIGLDPGMGLLHLDTRGRQSMALDLLEPVRPMVERFVLDLVATRTFRRGDFAEQADGSVILGAVLRAELAESLPEWSKSVAPHAESVAHSLGELVATDYHVTSPLTGAKRRAAVAPRESPQRHLGSSAAPRRGTPDTIDADGVAGCRELCRLRRCTCPAPAPALFVMLGDNVQPVAGGSTQARPGNLYCPGSSRGLEVRAPQRGDRSGRLSRHDHAEAPGDPAQGDHAGRRGDQSCSIGLPEREARAASVLLGGACRAGRSRSDDFRRHGERAAAAGKGTLSR